MLSRELNTSRVNIFSGEYPLINNYLYEEALEQKSRYGDTKEVLDFKLTLTNPTARCVGGQGRDVNIFFLLAEALWIWAGRKDVKFLNIFNSNMEQFSDDGKTFHAPYGFRLRHWGIASEDIASEENKHYFQGEDQIKTSIKLLSESNESRRVVMSIWNPDLDLDFSSKDLPCNDLVMFKIRNGGLHTTIANRSNDLHWGLPTNVFQFSFLSEIVAKILGVKFVGQTHNSQSLHFYTNNPIAKLMYDNYIDDKRSLYDFCKPSEMDFNFAEISQESYETRLALVDFHVNQILSDLERIYNTDSKVDNYEEIAKFSKYLAMIYSTLRTYVLYKKSKSGDVGRKEAVESFLNQNLGVCFDYHMLACNWFEKRLKDKKLSCFEENSIIGKL